jgi:hypothetical protein
MQGVVGRQAELLGLDVGRLAGQRQHLAERRQQRLEIGVGTRLAPDHLAARGRPRLRLDQLARQRRGVDVLALHFRQIGGLPGAQVATIRRGGLQQVGNFQVGL